MLMNSNFRPSVFLSIKLLCFITLFFYQCSEEEPVPDNNGKDSTGLPPETPPVKLSAREQAIKDFEENYLPSNAAFKDWSGNKVDCKPGSLPAEVLTRGIAAN